MFPNLIHAQPEISLVSESAILFDYDNNRVLWEKNPNKKLAIASTTKILTAILAIENKELDQDVTISYNAANSSYASMNMKTGEKFQLKYLLYALLLESCNDAAVAIAEHVSGSEKAFADLMNKKAKEIGAVNSNFVTASGLDIGVNHYSTAYDMALITSYAMKNETFREIFNTHEVSFPSSRKNYYFENQNKMFDEYAESIGGKTGYTSKAQSSYIGTFESDGKKILCVVLRSSSQGKWSDTRKLINYGLQNYSVKEIHSPDFNLQDDNVLSIKKTFYMLLNNEEYNNMKINFTPNRDLSVFDAGKFVGVINFSLNDNNIFKQDLYVSDDIQISHLENNEIKDTPVKYLHIAKAN